MSANPSPSPNEILRGGIAEHPAHLWDGTTETVSIRMLPVREYESFARVLENEPRMAEILCGRPEGWGDTLRPDSLGEIITQGERLNADFFVPWFRRRAERMERLVPGSVGQSGQGSPSPSSSPKSASGPA
jgi:hypothetical protein